MAGTISAFRLWIAVSSDSTTSLLVVPELTACAAHGEALRSFPLWSHSQTSTLLETHSCAEPLKDCIRDILGRGTVIQPHEVGKLLSHEFELRSMPSRDVRLIRLKCASMLGLVRRHSRGFLVLLCSEVKRAGRVASTFEEQTCLVTFVNATSPALGDRVGNCSLLDLFEGWVHRANLEWWELIGLRSIVYTFARGILIGGSIFVAKPRLVFVSTPTTSVETGTSKDDVLVYFEARAISSVATASWHMMLGMSQRDPGVFTVVLLRALLSFL